MKLENGWLVLKSTKDAEKEYGFRLYELCQHSENEYRFDIIFDTITNEKEKCMIKKVGDDWEFYLLEYTQKSTKLDIDFIETWVKQTIYVHKFSYTRTPSL